MGMPKEELHRLVDRLPERHLMKAKRYLEMLAKSMLPNSAATPRPDNKPAYVAPNCPECSTPLVLADLLDDTNTPEEQIWYDEYICPTCLDCIYLDWPQDKMASLNEEQYQEGGAGWDELKRELNL